jgi:hypothetical protein
VPTKLSKEHEHLAVEVKEMPTSSGRIERYRDQEKRLLKSISNLIDEIDQIRKRYESYR